MFCICRNLSNYGYRILFTNSYTTLFLLILLLDGITYFIFIFFKSLLQPMMTSMPNWLSIALLSIIEITLDWFVIHTADDWIESVQMSNIAELCVALFLYTLNILFSDKTE
ncbi:YrvL family regulatory protein [Bacillus toyonensis]|uniref:YrvL family regulatory protein n=1 Tax=Bacillus toyonensis TaxID=155322 RepID=UPI0038239F6D